MQASTVTLAFVAALLASLALKFLLATRQIRHVLRHRGEVPEPFNATIRLEAHQRAADYTVDRTRFGLVTEVFGAAVLLGWTLLGGLDVLNTMLRDSVALRWGPMAYQLALFGVFALVGGLLDLPFEAYRVFRIEQRHGFNRMTPRLFLADTLKSAVVGVVIGAPLLAAVLWVMSATGSWWWLWAWALWAGFILLMQVIYPTVIAPLFNRFKPLDDAALTNRVQALMHRCGFRSKGFFVMDGSRRSAHGNAYFAGMGRSKRVVFFDTLLARLQPEEVEAVLAHELGHFHHQHVRHRMLMTLALALAGLAALGWLSTQMAFYEGLGVQANLSSVPNDALALLLFMLTLPPVMFFITPLVTQSSRRAEFEADAYACAQASGTDLGRALLKLYEDNASTLTPDPLYVRFYYSHPPASERLAALPQARAAA